jgi:hypothetical protein
MSAICDVCKEDIISFGCLETHYKKQHPEYKPYSCKKCNTRFKSKSSISRHVKNKHSENPKRYKCTICSKVYTQKNNLDSHIASVHEKTDKYICNICKKVYYRKGDLTQHIKYVHDAIKNIECELCNDMFTQEKLLKLHIKRVHDKTKDCKCKICEEYFYTKSDARRHEISEHWTSEKRKQHNIAGWCKNCWFVRLAPQQQKNKNYLCDTCYCFKNGKKSQNRCLQNYFLDMVKSEYEKLYEELEFLPSTIDKKFVGGASCNNTRRQPDLGFVIGPLNNGKMRFLDVEFDEEAHKNRETSCELAKMDNTNEGVNNGKDEVIFIRIAIHYKSVKKTLKKRAVALSKKIHYWINRKDPVKELYVDNHPSKVAVEFLNYKKTEGWKHVEEALKHPNIEVLSVS